MQGGDDLGGAISAHLSGLAAEVARLESIVSDLIPDEGMAPSAVLVELQMLDRLRQSLEDLSLMVRASTVRIGATRELAGQLQLQTSLRLLDGREAPGHNLNKAGDIDLF